MARTDVTLDLLDHGITMGLTSDNLSMLWKIDVHRRPTITRGLHRENDITSLIRTARSCVALETCLQTPRGAYMVLWAYEKLALAWDCVDYSSRFPTITFKPCVRPNA